MKLRIAASLWVVASSSIFVVGCGNDLKRPADADRANSQNMGGHFDFGCGFADNPSGQQKQSQKSSYQPSQQQSCQKPAQQKIQYQEQSKITDFDVTLDCDQKQVVVKNQGKDQQREHFTIGRDGQVKGKMQFQGQMQSDGKGNQQCWVEYQVVFDGKATCPKPENTSAQQQKKLELKTEVKLTSTTPERVKSSGFGVNFGPSPTPSYSPAPSPTPSISISPIPLPSPLPTPTPSVTVIPITVCQEVDDSCSVSSNSNFSCN